MVIRFELVTLAGNLTVVAGENRPQVLQVVLPSLLAALPPPQLTTLAARLQLSPRWSGSRLPFEVSALLRQQCLKALLCYPHLPSLRLQVKHSVTGP